MKKSRVKQEAEAAQADRIKNVVLRREIEDAAKKPKSKK